MTSCFGDDSSWIARNPSDQFLDSFLLKWLDNRKPWPCCTPLVIVQETEPFHDLGKVGRAFLMQSSSHVCTSFTQVFYESFKYPYPRSLTRPSRLTLTHSSSRARESMCPQRHTKQKIECVCLTPFTNTCASSSSSISPPTLPHPQSWRPRKRTRRRRPETRRSASTIETTFRGKEKADTRDRNKRSPPPKPPSRTRS